MNVVLRTDAFYGSLSEWYNWFRCVDLNLGEPFTKVFETSLRYLL